MAQTTTDAEQVVRAYEDLWNNRAYSKIPEVVSESFVHKDPAVGEVRGHDGLEAFIREIKTGFPDFQVEIINLLASDSLVMDEAKFTMTHEGEFNDIPPTGREVEFRGMAINHIEDGKLQEHRQYYDRQDFFHQLGLTDE
jgi:steroid delta-isomerase-like uncharacterized protein